MLVHVGRRTGKRRHTVLEVMEYRRDGPEMIVMSAFGREADWLRNIEARPECEVAVGGRRFSAMHRIVGTEEAVKVIAGYERRNRLAAPIIRAVLNRLLGWRYDGSERARRRLAEQLPLVAFRPGP
jgi:deazaflavin-dependent oxidoreductase (nitroreductase family)